VALLAEGLIERLDPDTWSQIERDPYGNVQLAELELPRLLKGRVAASLGARGIATSIVAKDIGYELRCAPPGGFDIHYCRGLGYWATRFLLDGGTDAMVTLQGDTFVPVPFRELIDAKTQRKLAMALGPMGIFRRQVRDWERRRWCYVLDAERLAELRTRYGAGGLGEPQASLAIARLASMGGGLGPRFAIDAHELDSRGHEEEVRRLLYISINTRSGRMCISAARRSWIVDELARALQVGTGCR